MADVGDGASFTMTGFTGDIISINNSGISRGVVDSTHLGTSAAKTFIPGDLYDPGEVELTVQHDPNEQPPFTASATTATITYPTPSGGASGATHAASGFVSSWDPGNIANDELMTSSVTVKWTGAITFTDST